MEMPNRALFAALALLAASPVATTAAVTTSKIPKAATQMPSVINRPAPNRAISP